MDWALEPTGLWLAKRPPLILARTFGHDEFQRWFQGDTYREWFHGIIVAMSTPRGANPGRTMPARSASSLIGMPQGLGGPKGTPSSWIFIASGTLTVPAGALRLFAKLWGPGAGGSGNNGGGAAVAGTGGGYAESLFIVAPGQAIPVTIGAPGTAGTDAPTTGGTSGASAFSTLAVTGAANGSGPGVGSGGTYNATGGAIVGGVTGGPSAADQNGTLGAGGTFGNAGSQPGANGATPGGGGGGVAGALTAYGGFGGPGLLIVSWAA